MFEDSRSIKLLERDICGLSDEEILARFVKGFFGGWVFAPERGIIGVFEMMGRPMVPMAFSGLCTFLPYILVCKMR